MNRRLYKYITNTNLDAYFVMDKSGKILDVNDAALAIYGYSREELLTLTLHDIEAHESHDETRQHMAKIIGSGYDRFESLHCRKDGTIFNVDVSSSFDPEGENFLSFYRDITDSKRIAEQLRVSEENYRSFYGLTSDYVHKCSRIGSAPYRVQWTGGAVGSISGYTPEEIYETGCWLPFVHPDDREAVAAFLAGLAPGDIRQTEFRLVTKQGESRWISERLRCVAGEQEGELLLFGAATDITEKRVVEEGLRQAQELFTLFMKYSPVYTFIKQVEGAGSRIVQVSNNYVDLLGKQVEELRGCSMEDLFPPDFASKITADDIAVVTEGKVVQHEQELNGRCYTTIKFPILREGRESLLAGFALDNTDRKMAEKEREQYFRLFNSSSDLMCIYEPDGFIKRINPAVLKTVGYSASEILGRSAVEFVHPDDRQKTIEEMGNLSQGKASHSFENRLLCKDGTVCWISWRAFYDNEGEYIYATGRDVTEHRNNLAELDYVNECFTQALNGSQHILYRLNVKKGCYDYMSPAFEAVTGYPVAEFRKIGLEQLKGFFHPEDESRVFTIIDERFRAREGKMVNFELEYRLRKADGGYCWLHDATTACFNDKDELECFFGSAHDISPRKETEAALQRAKDELEDRVRERTADLLAASEKLREMSFELMQTEEKERARIAAELHDEVGQSLLLAKMKLDMLSSCLDSEPQRQLASEAVSLLGKSLHDVRNLTFEMRPPLLDSAGIIAALERLCAALAGDYGLEVTFSSACESLPLDQEAAYSLYQSLRELLINVAKHARTDRAELTITVETGFAIVQIRDCGIGFEYSDVFRKQIVSSGVGLFNVQQRIERLGGAVAIVSASGKGTSVTLRIPLAAE